METSLYITGPLLTSEFPSQRPIIEMQSINSSPCGQNGRHFADDIFKSFFVNKEYLNLTLISLKFVPKGPIDNKSTLDQVMAWCRTGDKPLPEPILPYSMMHICGTRGSCVNVTFFDSHNKLTVTWHAIILMYITSTYSDIMTKMAIPLCSDENFTIILLNSNIDFRGISIISMTP